MNAATIRGFNYSGSWGTSGLDVWVHHDHGRMAKEVSNGKRYFPGWNTVRWWLSDEAFYRDEERFLANFEAGLGLFAAHGVAVVPVLFNRWRDPICDFGGTPVEFLVPGYCHMSSPAGHDPFGDHERPAAELVAPIERLHRRYLEAVVGGFAQDGRIAMWDLCNEPLMAAYSNDPEHHVTRAELRWLGWLYRSLKGLGARQPTTIGNFFNLDVMRMTAPYSDVMGFHPYFMPNMQGANTGHNASTATKDGFIRKLDAAVELADSLDKSLFASETVWGDVDSAARVTILHETLQALSDRRIGFTVHALQHSLVADLHYPAYGPIGMPMCMHFVDPDGEVRAGHAAFNQYASDVRSAAYESRL